MIYHELHLCISLYIFTSSYFSISWKRMEDILKLFDKELRDIPYPNWEYDITSVYGNIIATAITAWCHGDPLNEFRPCIEISCCRSGIYTGCTVLSSSILFQFFPCRQNLFLCHNITSHYFFLNLSHMTKLYSQYFDYHPHMFLLSKCK